MPLDTPDAVDAFRRLLRAGAVGRLPRSRPRDEGETTAMARMARRRWIEALRTGEIEVTPTGYRWNRGPQR